MVYGPIVPTSYRHAALPSFSLSVRRSASLLRILVPVQPPRNPCLSLFLSRPATRSRFPARPAFSRTLSLRRFHGPSRLVPRPGCPAASAKAGNPDRGSERELATERKLTLWTERSRFRGRVIKTETNDLHIHMLERTRMRWGFICKGVVNGGRGHGVGYRPVVSFSFCFHLLSNLVPLPGHHHSPPRRSRSILIYENRLASSFLEIVVFAFTKDRLSLSPSLLSLFRALAPSRSFSLSCWQALALTRMATMT